MELLNSNIKPFEMNGYDGKSKTWNVDNGITQDIGRTCSALVYSFDDDDDDDDDEDSLYSSSTASHTFDSAYDSTKNLESEENTYDDGNENHLSYFERYQSRRNRSAKNEETKNEVGDNSNMNQADKIMKDGTSSAAKRSDNSMKEITIMPIGTKSRAHFVVKGSPKITYSVADICANKVSKRNRSKQQYRLESHRTGRVFHRIKPRPVLMDTTKFSTNSTIIQRKENVSSSSTQKFLLAQEQHDNKVLVCNHAEDIISMITAPVIGPATTQVKSPVHEDSTDTNIANETNVKKGKSQARASCNDNETFKSSTEWRKKVPENAGTPKEFIDAVEVEYKESITSSTKTSRWNRSITKNEGNFHIRIGEIAIDQANDGKPLTSEEIEKMTTFQKKRSNGFKTLSKKIIGTTQGFFASMSARSSSSEVSVGSIHVDEVPEERELVVNKDGTVSNRKVVYKKIGIGTSSELKILKIDEDIVPQQDSSDILVQVEASTVSKMDSKVRHNHQGVPFQIKRDVITPGIDIIGRVMKSSDTATIDHGIYTNDRVASLVGCGGNAMYITLKACNVTRVPTLVSSASAAVVVESYLPAYQALLLGIPESDRFNLSCLQNKNVLIFGGISTVGQAMIELAFLFGASKVYTTAISKHHKQVKSLGASPLEIDCRFWTQEIKESIDIAVDSSCDEPDKNCLEAIRTDGTFVCFGKGKSNDAHVGWMEGIVLRLFSPQQKGCKIYTYNVFDSWEADTESSKSDLSYLFGLLKSERINPQVAATLKLSKVKDAHTYLDGNRRIQGTFVCLPNL